jgi:hypothetical protein
VFGIMSVNEAPRRAIGTLIILVTVAAIATAGTAAAQSVDEVQTTLTDTDGDGTDDTAEVNVTVSDAARTVVVFDETEFDVDVSPTDDSQEDIVQLDGNRAQFDSIGGAEKTYTVVADLSDYSAGDTGSVNVTVDEGVATETVTYTIGGEDGDSEGDETDSGDSGGETGDTGSGGDGDDSAGEGMPGFTSVAALLALVLSAVCYAFRD